jgi:hypothetical protein
MSWSDNLAAVDHAVAGYFDEQCVKAIPMAKPARQVNAALVADPSRQSFDFMATIELDPGMDAIGTTMRPNANSDGSRHVAKVCLTALSSCWPWMPKQNDRLECDGVLYTITAAPDRDGTDRVAYWLNKVAS